MNPYLVPQFVFKKHLCETCGREKTGEYRFCFVLLVRNMQKLFEGQAAALAFSTSNNNCKIKKT